MASIEKRVVFYPCIIAGNVVERVGVFDVHFNADGQPTRAEMPRFVGYETTFELVNFCDEIAGAILERENLHCQNPIDLDNAPAWDGCLSFEPASVVL